LSLETQRSEKVGFRGSTQPTDMYIIKSSFLRGNL
jgi:hypothetical protein